MRLLPLSPDNTSDFDTKVVPSIGMSCEHVSKRSGKGLNICLLDKLRISLSDLLTDCCILGLWVRYGVAILDESLDGMSSTVFSHTVSGLLKPCRRGMWQKTTGVWSSDFKSEWTWGLRGVGVSGED